MDWRTAGGRYAPTGSSTLFLIEQEIMRTKRKNAVAMLFSAGALLAVAPVATLAQAVGGGHLADFSGPTADVGRPYGQGVADALAYINRHGGVGGRKIAAETVDYSYKA